MGFYLLEHPNRNYKQYRETRRNGAKPSGTVVLHTAENATDVIGPDSGAEGVAAFIASRTNAGSYHVLCDSDSTIQLAPWWYETWQDTSTNNWAVGISGAISCRDWKRLGKRGDDIVIRMANAAREYAAWLKNERGITIPARRITRAQALRREPGFIGHGEIDTGRRSDPGADFNWDLFLKTFAEGSPDPEELEDKDDKMWYFGRLRDESRVWVGDGITRRPVENPQQLADLQHRIRTGEVKGNLDVIEFESESRLNFLGMPVGPQVWSYGLPAALGEGLQVGPSTAEGFVRFVALGIESLQKKGVEVTVDADQLAHTIALALEGKVATAEGVEKAVRKVFKDAGEA